MKTPSSLRILYNDGNPEILEIVSSILSEEFGNNSTECFLEVKDAITSIQQGKEYDIIVSDLEASSTGENALTQAAKEHNISPIFLLTSSSSSTSRPRNIGNYYFFPKPFSLIALMNEIKDILVTAHKKRTSTGSSF